jgi:hypothetical protein
MRVSQQSQQTHLVRKPSYSAQDVCVLRSVNIQGDTRIVMVFGPYSRGRSLWEAAGSSVGGLRATEVFQRG